MSRQYTLTACHRCQLGHRARDMYEVESTERAENREGSGTLSGYEGKVLICGPCYDKYQYGENLDGNPARERS